MLKLRVISAALGIPLTLAAVYAGGVWYLLLIWLLSNLGLHEYLNIYRSCGYRPPAISAYLGVNGVLGIIFIGRTDLIYPAITALFLILSLQLLAGFNKCSALESALALWGIIYLGGLGGHLLLIRFLPRGIAATGMLLLNVWGYDTCAYFAGIKWGRRKLAPEISPNKSVEGALAGALGAVFLSVAAAWLFPHLLSPLTAGPAVVLGLGVSIFSQLGDLLESALKRQTAVKDSGSLIPGHGGVLDRFDSLWMAAPFAYYFFLLIYG